MMGNKGNRKWMFVWKQGKILWILLKPLFEIAFVKLSFPHVFSVILQMAQIKFCKQKSKDVYVYALQI